MFNKMIAPALFLTVLASSHALAATNETKIISKRVTQNTKMCDPNSEYTRITGRSCKVKKVRFETQNYSIKDKEDPSPFYGTLAYLGFETNSWSDITKYAFVQRIRGCTYEVIKNADNTITKRIGESIMHLGKKRIYVFPDWSNDATTKDPLYYGPLEEDAHLPGGRVSLYRWTPKLGVVDAKSTKDLYQMIPLSEKQKAPLSPSVFVTDSPSMAYMKGSDGKTFQNVSLEFQVCLYDIKDIPLQVENDDPIAATPIVCHNWNSQYEYDFNKKDFAHLPNKRLDKFCASQEPLNPAEIFKREMQRKEK